MSAKLELRYILENFSYEGGLKMLEKYGDNPALLSLLKGSDNSFFKMKLQREIARLLDEAPDTPLIRPQATSKAPGTSQVVATHTPTIRTPTSHATASASGEPRTAGVSPYKYDLAQYPASVQELIRDKNHRVKEMDFLRGQLELLSTPERLSAALKILDLDDEIDEHWERIRHYEEHNELPAQDPADEDEVAAALAGIVTIQDIFRQEKNYQTYVTRAKSGKMKPEKLVFYEAVLAGIREKKGALENG